MWKYFIKRILALIPVIIGVTFIVFMILSFAPGDPAKSVLGEQAPKEAIDEMREKMGLNDPKIVQYFNYMKRLVQGDFGYSYKNMNIKVIDEIKARLPTTIKLSLVAILMAVVLSIPLGIIAAVKQNTWIDALSMFIALIGVSIPVFWLALLLIMLFSLKLGWLPSFGVGSWKAFILPGFSLGFLSMASIARITRSSMLEVIRQDYIRTARSKGVPYNVVIRKHALKNALIPTVTVVGLQIGGLLAGSVLTETVFALPGIGRYIIDSISGRDIPAVMGCIIVFTLGFSLINLLVDFLYAFIDPRIKSQYS